jgi:hypothetical protein
LIFFFRKHSKFSQWSWPSRVLKDQCSIADVNSFGSQFKVTDPGVGDGRNESNSLFSGQEVEILPKRSACHFRAKCSRWTSTSISPKCELLQEGPPARRRTWQQWQQQKLTQLAVREQFDNDQQWRFLSVCVTNIPAVCLKWSLKCLS